MVEGGTLASGLEVILSAWLDAGYLRKYLFEAGERTARSTSLETRPIVDAILNKGCNHSIHRDVIRVGEGSNLLIDFVWKLDAFHDNSPMIIRNSLG